MANHRTETSSQTDTTPEKNDQFWGGVFLFLVVIGIVAGIFSTLDWMMDDERLPLSRLVIEGELEQVTVDEVQSAFTQIPEMGTFMTQDINELQQVLEPLPWIKHVSIRKQWPDLVKVYIVEYEAQAIWNGQQLLDPEGTVFKGEPAEASDDIINLYGPDSASSEVLSVWKDSSKLLDGMGLTIQSVVLNDRRAWQMILDNGIRLELGKDVHENRLKRFIRLYEALGDKAQKVSYIDLRYDTGAAIGWITDEN